MAPSPPRPLRAAALLLVAALSGCAFALGGTSAHPRAVYEDDFTAQKWKPIGGGWYRYDGVVSIAAVGNLGLGVSAGQKYLRLDGGLSDRKATPGAGAERHVDLNLAVWRLGVSCSFGIFDQWVDYAGGYRMAWTGKLLAPRVSFAPVSWASVYAGYGFLSGRDLTVGPFDPDTKWWGTAFQKNGRDGIAKYTTGKGTQKFAGVDVTAMRVGRGKLGVKIEYQETASEPLGLPGMSADARFRSKGLGIEAYLGSF
ncbi:MAG: hypothetical protein QM704_01615 [Anaeromyxobacteraceae bacterium]